MNRRNLLGLFAGAASAAVLDPERLLWMPGRKLISIPAPQSSFYFAGMPIVAQSWMPKNAIWLSPAGVKILFLNNSLPFPEVLNAAVTTSLRISSGRP